MFLRRTCRFSVNPGTPADGYLNKEVPDGQDSKDSSTWDFLEHRPSTQNGKVNTDRRFLTLIGVSHRRSLVSSLTPNAGVK